MKKVLFITALMLLPMLASAAVEINGIYYKLNNGAMTAEVTRTPDSYKGDVTIPETVEYGGTTYSVTSIGGYAFSGYWELTSVTIGNSVTSIGKRAFYSTGLTSITIPGSVTSIGMNAFSCCTGLTSITIPSSVTSIGVGAFNQCTGLTSVTIPSSVTSIGESAFSWCSSLTLITVDGANTKYKSVDGVLMSKFGSTLLAYPAGKVVTVYTIPSGVTTISREAFTSCLNLTSITIPGSVNSIGESAFWGSNSLTDLYCLAENAPTMPYDNVFDEEVF